MSKGSSKCVDCRDVCFDHEEAMNPEQWGTLPDELLQLIFARLPVNKIHDLRFVSKYWKESLDARGDYSFLRACDEAHPKMFALISKVIKREGPRNLFLVQVFDTKFNSWHTFQVSNGIPERHWPMRMICEDGGLVLFVAEGYPVPETIKSIRSFFFRVINPLTGYACDLPTIVDGIFYDPQCITVDCETNRFEVLIVVNRGGTATQDIQVFRLETGQWSQPSEAKYIMFGNQLAYDFVMGRLPGNSFGIRGLWNKYEELDHTFLKNHLFVLRIDTNALGYEFCNRPQKACIKEYVVEYHPHHPSTWLEVDVHYCPFEINPFEINPTNESHSWKLLSSNGFLVVFGTSDKFWSWDNTKGWLYDLSTRTWCALPKLQGRIIEWPGEVHICEIQWNAHPR